MNTDQLVDVSINAQVTAEVLWPAPWNCGGPVRERDLDRAYYALFGAAIYAATGSEDEIYFQYLRDSLRELRTAGYWASEVRA